MLSASARRLRGAACAAIAIALGGCAGAPRPSVVDAVGAGGALATVQEIRMWHAPDRSRIVFDMDRRAAFNAFTLPQPDRVVIDLRGARLRGAVPAGDSTGQFIRAIRHGRRADDVARLVFDLAKPARYSIQMLAPSGGYQYRLVVDFRDAVAAAAAPPPRAASPKPKGELLILIDPGHGGEDPGAVGKRTYEKHVVLSIAKRLKAHIERRPGRRAELTRASDYYIPLRKRTRIAQQRDADLFISIHADAFTNSKARGASVYALSQRGASSETAKWLANKENAADLAGGINLAEQGDDLAKVLLDLSMSDTVNQSISLGRDVLAELARIGRVHSKRVEQAGFVVLKSPDIPSILVETAYITNPTEEKLLMSPQHQERIAAAIAAGIEKHIAKNGSRYAVR